MKLYEVPRNTGIRVLEEGTVPPAAPAIHKGDILRFHEIDGMYSVCYRGEERVYLAAYTEVEIIEKEK